MEVVLSRSLVECRQVHLGGRNRHQVVQGKYWLELMRHVYRCKGAWCDSKWISRKNGRRILILSRSFTNLIVLTRNASHIGFHHNWGSLGCSSIENRLSERPRCECGQLISRSSRPSCRDNWIVAGLGLGFHMLLVVLRCQRRHFSCFWHLWF